MTEWTYAFSSLMLSKGQFKSLGLWWV